MARPQEIYWTNPVAAQSQANIVRMYDIDRMRADDLNRSMSTNAQTISQRGAAKDQLASQRMAEDRRLSAQMSEAEKARAARDKELDKTIQSNEKIAGIEASAISGAQRNEEAYKFTLAAVSGDDPPTDSEFASMTEGLDKDRINRLKGLLATSRRAADAAAAVGETLAANWNQQLKKLPPGKTAEQLLEEFRKTSDRNQVLFDSASGKFLPARSRARMDSAASGIPTIDSLKGKMRAMVPGGSRPGIVTDDTTEALAAGAVGAPFPRASELAGPPAPERPGLPPAPVVQLQPGAFGSDLPQAPADISALTGSGAAPAALAGLARLLAPLMPAGTPGLNREMFTSAANAMSPPSAGVGNPIPAWARAGMGAYQPPQEDPGYRIISVDDILRANPRYTPREAEFDGGYLPPGVFPSDFVPARRLAPPPRF